MHYTGALSCLFLSVCRSMQSPNQSLGPALHPIIRQLTLNALSKTVKTFPNLHSLHHPTIQPQTANTSPFNPPLQFLHNRQFLHRQTPIDRGHFGPIPNPWSNRFKALQPSVLAQTLGEWLSPWGTVLTGQPLMVTRGSGRLEGMATV